jgi:hypothetical protein
VWSSASTSATYDLAVVDPDAPGALVSVDQVPALSASSAWMVHIYGGTWNAATGKLVDPGVRHVVYLKNGAIYRVTLDKGGAAPTAVQLSTESAAESGSLIVAAQNRDGSDALIGYTVRSGLTSVPRYVRLSTPAGSAPLAPPSSQAIRSMARRRAGRWMSARARSPRCCGPASRRAVAGDCFEPMSVSAGRRALRRTPR